MNPLKELLGQGQSVWLDYIRRNLIVSGELKKLVEEDGIRGVTSNPTIFEKAIAHSTDYDAAFRAVLAEQGDAEPGKIYEPLAIEDIQMAADVLRPVYDETSGQDGYVSLEVSPHLAHDTQRTIAEAKRLKAVVGRPNVMIKVPATPEGIPAIEELIADGVNVNITLMFSLDHYEAVARAYIRGLERCAHPAEVASVASFFVSRVDTMVDRALASTGTKNPAYSDVLYVENLIGPETVNTLPPETLHAFREHGQVAGDTVRDKLDAAAAALRSLQAVGIDLNVIAEKLQQDGVAAFAASFDQLMGALEKKRESLGGVELDHQELHLGKFQRRVNRRLKDWQAQRFGSRLWNKDPTLWSSEAVPELTDRLGWLELPETMKEKLGDLRAFADQVKSDGVRHVVLLGMGGSSLAPEVFQRTFGNQPGYPALIVLDSTHPAAVKSVEAQIDLAHTLFLVSSKSGTTTETSSFFYYFWDKLKQVKTEPGKHFVAITDPGTPLEKLAAERQFRATFTAPVEVGGRYSALTVFGLLPAALIGVEIGEVLARARQMGAACGAEVQESHNPGLALGAALGELTSAKKDKVTFLCSRSLAAFPAWVEQLIAESTGKDRKGIVPVVNEPLESPEKYGADRFFVYLRLKADESHEIDRNVAALEANGHPVARIDLGEKQDLGQEFFRWEIAVAAAGAAMGIHPFNQPDVQLAKDLAKKAMGDNADGKKGGVRVKEEVSILDRSALHQAVSSWLAKSKARDYVVIQAYLNPTPQHTAILQAIGRSLRDRLRLATTLGYGPRFLHSTGQLHKGGPNSVLVLQIVDQPADNLVVPETNYTFDSLIQAQALGDFTALKQRRRRVLRVNLEGDTAGGLRSLADALGT